MTLPIRRGDEKLRTAGAADLAKAFAIRKNYLLIQLFFRQREF